MTPQLSEQQNQLIENIALNNGFKDYEVLTNPGSGKGDNFLGILTLITIQSGERKLDLILKTAHQNEAFRKAAPLEEVYKREIYIYEVVFNEFKKFQDENNIKDQFTSYPKMYGAITEECQECLIMEDLKTIGYQLWNKKYPMNRQHLSAVLREYAKYHAVSLAMRDKKPKLFAQLSERLPTNVFENSDLVSNPEKLKAYIKGTFNTAFEAVEHDNILTECVQKLMDQLPDIFMNDIRQSRYKIVINHGDSWCNNFLFKYQDANNNLDPSSLRIIDWQLSYLSSPASDFCYFYLAHSDKEMFDNYQDYLGLYYETLSSQLRDFGCDPEDVFPMSEMQDHCKLFMKSNISMVMAILKIMLCESEDAPDLAKSASEDGDLTQAFSFRVSDFGAYKERVVNVIEFMKDNDYVD